MATLRAPGRPDQRLLQLPRSVREALGGGKAEEVEVKGAVRIEAARADEPPVEIRVDDETKVVVELELEGGLKQFVRLDQFREDYGIEPSRDAADTIEIPSRLGRTERSRGLAADLALKAFRLIDFPLEEKAALKVAEHFEGKVAQGLRRWSVSKGLADAPVEKPSGLPSGHPLLVFLHGTASTALGSFGGLPNTQPEVWRELHDRYGERVYAFEHPSLTRSPIENAIELLKVLPDDATLHLVSHSRGGLVGELLCRTDVRRAGRSRAPFAKDDFEQFRGAEYAGQRQALEQLGALLKRKKPKVERFVRVACPARGTLLASERLDKLFSLLVNVLNKTTGADKVFVIDFATSLAMATAKERSDPETLPGIEAMIPDSPLVKVLNRPDIEVPADLTVISGDIEGEGFWQRLKVLATDLFYWQDHDLVVNTRAMYGGARRTRPARFFFDQGAHVSHFNYFRNETSVGHLRTALTDEGAESARFKLLTREERQIRLARARDGETRGVVFLLPGIMGSNLSVAGNRIWVDPVEIAKGRLGKLKIGAAGVKPDSLIAKAYADLAEYLSRSYEVVPFPYDWRLSLEQEAQRLAEALSEKLRATNRPVRIVAHSMGGMLARTMIAKSPAVWQQLKERGVRLVMLGTPNGGSHVINSVLLGRERVLRNLARLDFKNDRREVLDIVRRYRGLLELLPEPTEGVDYFSRGVWDRLHGVDAKGWVPPEASDLAAAAKLRRALAPPEPVDATHMSYIAGQAPATPIAVEIDADAKRSDRIRILATAEGDGRVPWETGILPGVRTWYVNVRHGSLANDRDSFPAIVDLIERGETNRLSATPPVSRGAVEPFEMPLEEPPVFPDTDELEDAALGLAEIRRYIDEISKIKVKIVHGDLRHATSPVLVGHYQDDIIVGAEGVLNWRLNNSLQLKRELGLYPGPIESGTVVLDPNAKPPGAIIVGLGTIGSLSPGDLRRTIARGFRDFAERRVSTSTEETLQLLGVAAILVGSGEGGVSLADSVRAILEGATEANAALQATALKDRVRIGSIELIEIHQDRAVRASRILRSLQQEKRFDEAFNLSDWRVEVGRGGWKRIAAGVDPEWWTRMQITERRRDGALEFLALTDRARAEAHMLATQRASLDAFLERAVKTVRSDVSVARTLFELLLPNQLKDAAPRERNLVLVLDKAAARYPWELLQDGSQPEAKPPAVRAGLVRQMQTHTFRRTPVHAPERAAFVVGNPPTSPDEFVPLPGAEAEAREVVRLLEDFRFEVEDEIATNFERVFSGLFARPYKVLHLAGHGVFEHETDEAVDSDCSEEECPSRNRKRQVTGMVLADDVFLTPAEIEQMRVVPELVFINCCHLGRAEGEHVRDVRYHELAANLGTQIIEMGAKAVIAAGWAVQDDAAKLFASIFYRRMLAGATFGDAVQQARQATWDEHPDVNTWGAYQCYGDPGYTLVKARGGSRPLSSPSIPEEAVIELGNLAEQAAKRVDREELAAIGRKVEELRQGFPKRWLEQAEVLEALGSTLRELRQFEAAVETYERLRIIEPARFTVRALENLANLHTRWAIDLFRADSGTEAQRRKRARQQIATALSEVDLLITLGETKERYCLRGSAFKRKALLERGEARDQALCRMRDAYRRAHEIAVDRTGAVDYYPTLNWLTARALLNARGDRDRLTDLEERLAEVEAVVAASGSERSFFDGVALIDVDLTRGLKKGSLEDVARLGARYLEQRRRESGSPRKFSSVQEHVRLLAEVLGEELEKRPRQAKRRRLARQLAALSSELDK